MRKPNWTPIGAVNPQALTEARLQAHQAVQWLARAAYANLNKVSGDAHGNLGWNDIYGALMTREMTGDVAVGLRLRDLTMFLERDTAASVTFALDGSANLDAGRWLSLELERCGLRGGIAELPYGADLPPRVTGLEGEYGLIDGTAHLRELANWFANAAEVLQTIADDNGDIRPGPSEVRCWPHHFDIATLIMLDDDGPETARSIGVGLSPGDGTYAEPYFYVSPWPYPEAGSLPALPGIGSWHTEGFVAAVLTGSEIADTANQGAAVLQFLRMTVTTCRKLLEA